jgi:hypothetical protein
MPEGGLQDLYAAEALRILTAAHASRANDHLVDICGDHGSGWIAKDAIYPHTERLERLCRAMANVVRGWGAEAVCGPATGGLIVAAWTAHELGARSVSAEHDPAPRGTRCAAGSCCGAATTEWCVARACWSWMTSCTRGCRCGRRPRRCAAPAATWSAPPAW